jgi:hypothetical protein
MRTIPAELVKRYEAEGWWTRDTLGDLLARMLGKAPESAFRVHSEVRPWQGTFKDVELVARRLAAPPDRGRRLTAAPVGHFIGRCAKDPLQHAKSENMILTSSKEGSQR